MEERQIIFTHTYSHTGYDGNEIADVLADDGAMGWISAFSRRWTAARDHIVQEEFWERELAETGTSSIEVCRHCGKEFLNARLRAGHERFCTGIEVALSSGIKRCRKCGLAVKNTKTRNQDEEICGGSDLANRTCPICNEVFEKTDPLAYCYAYVTRHIATCRKKRAREEGQDELEKENQTDRELGGTEHHPQTVQKTMTTRETRTPNKARKEDQLETDADIVGTRRVTISQYC